MCLQPGFGKDQEIIFGNILGLQIFGAEEMEPRSDCLEFMSSDFFHPLISQVFFFSSQISIYLSCTYNEYENKQ